MSMRQYPKKIVLQALLTITFSVFFSVGFTDIGETMTNDLATTKNSIIQMEEMVVTARGTGSLISQTPGGVGIIDRDILSEQQPISVTQAARRLSGVEKSSDSIWGSAINIRGLGRNSVIFLIDGCRVNTATDINAQFGLINPSDIERIEVLKGPISALYGSGSIGGVVNVITQKGRCTENPEQHGEISVTYADNPQGADSYINASAANSEHWLFASGSYRDRNSYEAGDGETVHNSQFRDRYGKAAAGIKWNEAHQTELSGLYSEANHVGIPGKGLSLPSGPDVTYPKAALTQVHLTHIFTPEKGGTAGIDGLSEVVWDESTLNLFYQKIQRRVCIDDFPEGMPLEENRPGADHDTQGVKWNNRIRMGSHTVTLGTDLCEWQIDNSERYKTMKNGIFCVDSSLGNLKQFSGGIYAEDDWHIGRINGAKNKEEYGYGKGDGHRFVLNIGGRMDYIAAESDDLPNWINPPTPLTPVVIKREGERFDDVSWNLHAGVTWNVAPHWSVTAIAASSYRAPDLMDRFKYINLGGGVELFGNPELDPERSLFFEGGLHFTMLNLKMSASVYANDLDDLITEKIVSNTVHRMENVSEAKIYGAEFDAEWFVLPEWALYGSLTVTHGEDRTTNDNLSFIPPFNGVFGIRNERASGFRGSVEMEWAADQNDVPSGRMESNSWESVNARVGYSFSWGEYAHEIMLGVDNLFDCDYRNYLSTSREIELKEPGLNWLAMWKMRF